LEDLDIDGKTILNLILRKWGEEACTGFFRFRIGLLAGPCECGNKPSDYIKFGEFLDLLRKW
jgi:hypothetical protein